MRVFITHTFGGEDEGLGVALKEDLEAAGMEGYMAEKAQRYDLLISDKMRWGGIPGTKERHAVLSVRIPPGGLNPVV